MQNDDRPCNCYPGSVSNGWHEYTCAECRLLWVEAWMQISDTIDEIKERMRRDAT